MNSSSVGQQDGLGKLPKQSQAGTTFRDCEEVDQLTDKSHYRQSNTTELPCATFRGDSLQAKSAQMS